LSRRRIELMMHRMCARFQSHAVQLKTCDRPIAAYERNSMLRSRFVCGVLIGSVVVAFVLLAV
jgi:hypothetical protein